jgi:hypothetical protein
MDDNMLDQMAHFAKEQFKQAKVTPGQLFFGSLKEGPRKTTTQSDFSGSVSQRTVVKEELMSETMSNVDLLGSRTLRGGSGTTSAR